MIGAVPFFFWRGSSDFCVQIFAEGDGVLGEGVSLVLMETADGYLIECKVFRHVF